MEFENSENSSNNYLVTYLVTSNYHLVTYLFVKFDSLCWNLLRFLRIITDNSIFFNFTSLFCYENMEFENSENPSNDSLVTYLVTSNYYLITYLFIKFNSLFWDLIGFLKIDTGHSFFFNSTILQE